MNKHLLFSCVTLLFLLTACEGDSGSVDSGVAGTVLQRPADAPSAAKVLFTEPALTLDESGFTPFLEVAITVEGMVPQYPFAYVEVNIDVLYEASVLITQAIQIRLKDGYGHGTFQVSLAEFGYEQEFFSANVHPVSWWPAGELSIY